MKRRRVIRNAGCTIAIGAFQPVALFAASNTLDFRYLNLIESCMFQSHSSVKLGGTYNPELATENLSEVTIEGPVIRYFIERCQDEIFPSDDFEKRMLSRLANYGYALEYIAEVDFKAFRLMADLSAHLNSNYLRHSKTEHGAYLTQMLNHFAEYRLDLSQRETRDKLSERAPTLSFPGQLHKILSDLPGSSEKIAGMVSELTDITPDRMDAFIYQAEQDLQSKGMNHPYFTEVLSILGCGSLRNIKEAIKPHHLLQRAHYQTLERLCEMNPANLLARELPLLDRLVASCREARIELEQLGHAVDQRLINYAKRNVNFNI